jgi:hypothetical protein
MPRQEQIQMPPFVLSWSWGAGLPVIFPASHGLPPVYRLTIIRSLRLALRCRANVTQAIQMPGETLSEF